MSPDSRTIAAGMGSGPRHAGPPGSPPAGRRVQPRVRPARGTVRPARAEPLPLEDPPPLQSEAGRIMVVAAGSADALALQPGQHARHLPPPPSSRHRSGPPFSWQGLPPGAHEGGGSSRRASPTTETTPPGAPKDRHQHPPRHATPAAAATAHEQVICAVGTANTYRMSRHSYSAIRTLTLWTPVALRDGHWPRASRDIRRSARLSGAWGAGCDACRAGGSGCLGSMAGEVMLPGLPGAGVALAAHRPRCWYR